MLSASLTKFFKSGVGVWHVVLGSVSELSPALDEAVSLGSPVDSTLSSNQELVEAFREMLDAFFKFVWDLLSALVHGMHSDHVGNGSHGRLFGIIQLLGVLLLYLVLTGGVLGLSLGIEVMV